MFKPIGPSGTVTVGGGGFNLPLTSFPCRPIPVLRVQNRLTEGNAQVTFYHTSTAFTLVLHVYGNRETFMSYPDEANSVEVQSLGAGNETSATLGEML